MNDLFVRDSVTDGSQVTVPRYLQEGSTIINFKENGLKNNANIDLYSVSSGKVLYVKNIIINKVNSYSGEFQIRDGTTVKIYHTTIADTGYTTNLRFDPPMKFTDTVNYYADIYQDHEINITFTGWEEDV